MPKNTAEDPSVIFPSEFRSFVPLTMVYCSTTNTIVMRQSPMRLCKGRNSYQRKIMHMEINAAQNNLGHPMLESMATV